MGGLNFSYASYAFQLISMDLWISMDLYGPQGTFDLP